MESFLKQSGKIRGIEVLYFADAEIEKIQGNKPSFASFGPLSVLYFKDYNRFILQLNDWRYPLSRRLNISSSSSKDDSGSRTYNLPALSGSHYNLKINNVSNGQSFENFESILDNSSRFSVFGKEIPYRKIEESPDDKFVSRGRKLSDAKEMITETVKQVIQKVQRKASAFKSGTKNLTSTKKKLNLNELKTKDFRKDAKSRIKNDFISSTEKLSDEFLQRRKDNPNLTEAREFNDLKGTSDSQAPSLYLNKEEIEYAILKYKIINQRPASPEKPEEKKGLMASLRDGVQNVRGRVAGMLNTRDVARRDQPMVAPEMQGMAERMPIADTYQG